MAGDEPPDWGDTLIQPTGKKGLAPEAVLSIKGFPKPKPQPKPKPPPRPNKQLLAMRNDQSAD
jgi:hypothetical protein